MLGRDLVDVLRARPGTEVTAAGRAELDITDAAAVDAAVPGHDVVVNAAAWTAVDAAETDEAAAYLANATGAAHVAAACAASGAVMLHPSTDYVFGGDGAEPYDEDAPLAPLNAYGRTKAAGELAVREFLPERGYIVGTAWLYGEHGPNFVATMLRAAATREHLDVVDDQHGQPTWSWALAERLADLGTAALAGTAPAGVYHGTASGRTTWFGLAREIFTRSGLDPARVRPTTSDRFPRPAARPAFSVLGHGGWARAGMDPLPDWRDQLKAALERPTFTDLRVSAAAESSHIPS
jgi:dTDP-4-dehydrorhamnose reductase